MLASQPSPFRCITYLLLYYVTRKLNSVATRHFTKTHYVECEVTCLFPGQVPVKLHLTVLTVSLSLGFSEAWYVCVHICYSSSSFIYSNIAF